MSPKYDERRFLRLQERIDVIERRLDSLLQRDLNSSRCTFPLACRLLLRSGRLSPSQLLPGTRDLITSAIVEELVGHTELHIAELAKSLKAQTGHGDRKTIRHRMVSLERNGIAFRNPSTGAWRLSERFLEEWGAFVTRLATLERTR